MSASLPGSTVPDARRRVRPNWSFGAILAAATLLFLMLAYVSFAVFTSGIDAWSGFQGDYKIDAYYYLYLGHVANNLSDANAISLYDAAYEIRPNASSGGIVFMTAALLQLVRFDALIPLVFVLALMALAGEICRQYGASKVVLWLPFCGLFPYLYVPSKEGFFILGMLLLVWAVLRGRGVMMAAFGLALVYLARPEAFFILCGSAVIYAASRRRFTLALLVVGTTVGYIAFAREPAEAAAVLTQTAFDSIDLAFCNVGPLDVCVSGQSGMEWVFLMRLVSMLLLPPKWIVDVASTLGSSTLDWSEIIVRWANFAHLVWLWFAYRNMQPVSGRTQVLRRVLVLFSILYFLIYASVFYFQPSRQAVVASTVAGLA